MLLTGETEARGENPVPVPLCPQNSTAQHSTRSVPVANRITKLRDVVSQMTALTVQLVCPYMSVGRQWARCLCLPLS
jgi:hypothetical protein